MCIHIWSLHVVLSLYRVLLAMCTILCLTVDSTQACSGVDDESYSKGIMLRTPVRPQGMSTVHSKYPAQPSVPYNLGVMVF